MRRMLSTAKARCLYIATTRQQAEELMWAPLKDLLERLDIGARFNETKLKCTFTRNDAQLTLVGADDKRQIEKFRGQPFHEVHIDEFSSYPAKLLEHLIQRIIGPRLGDYGGCLVTYGTPGHVLAGPAYESTRPGSEISRHWRDRAAPEYDNWLGWSLHTWSLQDGAPYVPAMARLWQEALIEKTANGWSDQHPVWRREFLGQWAADDTENVFKYRPHLEDGSQWNQWDPERTPQGLAVLPPGDWQYVYGMDFGYTDAFALCVFAFKPDEKLLYHVAEIEKKGIYARQIAELLIGPDLKAEKPTGLIGATGWPVAMVGDKDAGGAGLMMELANVYGVRIEAAEKKEKHDAIELFNGDLLDGRIKVLKGSKLEEQLLNLQWAVDDFGALKENKGQKNDLADAAVYARRKAHHLFSQLVAAHRPARNTPQAADLEMAESEERKATPRDDFESYLGDAEYNDWFGN